MPSTHRLEMTVADGPLALDRVVATCRARGAAITGLHFEAGDRHRPGQLVVSVAAEHTRVPLLVGRLGGLVDVLSVRRG
jgi:acetolactate synthase regulatory subunit